MVILISGDVLQPKCGTWRCLETRRIRIQWQQLLQLEMDIKEADPGVSMERVMEEVQIPFCLQGESG